MNKRHLKMHEALKAACRHRARDYDPWGKNERWKDGNKSYPDCSCGCKHFVLVEGQAGADWGVCINPASHRVGLLTFEHQGCQKYEFDRRYR